MRYVAYDCETWPIQTGVVANRLVCGTFAGDGYPVPKLLRRQEALEELLELLTDSETILIGHNMAFDMSVACEQWPEVMIPVVFQAYREGRIRDTYIRERLINLAKGSLKYDWKGSYMRYRLSDLVERHLGIDISEKKSGTDIWRVRYNEQEGVPLSEWPHAAKEYATDDAIYTFDVFLSQGKDLVVDEIPQTKAHFGLYLGTCWGIRTDVDKVLELEEACLEKVKEAEKIGLEHGLVRIKYDGTTSKNQKAIQEAVQKAYKEKGGSAPRTDKGNIKYDTETLLKSGNKALQEFAKGEKPGHHISHFINPMKPGWVNPSYGMVKSTGRTSSFNPNIQNQPKKGGFRECYVPREGRVFVACDYSQLELCTLAQVCLDLFGYSALADAINDGQDCHVRLLERIISVPYDEIMAARAEDENAYATPRDHCKVYNYGFPGGMGAATMYINLLKQGYTDTTPQDAERGRDAWMETWPEVVDYLDMISEAVGATGTGDMIHPRSLRKKGGASYTQMANAYFQGMAGDGTARCSWELAQAMYVPGWDDRLYGARMAAFVHDEYLLSVEESKAQAAREALSEYMVRDMQVFTPDVRIEAEAVITRQWSKKAKPTFNEEGTMIPWENAA